MQSTFQYTLRVRANVVHPTAKNFRLPAWPPPQDFPVVIDSDGNVISRIRDTVWYLGAWADRTCSINFADGPLRKGTAWISPANALILREVAAWWLWGAGSVTTSAGIVSRVSQIKPIFIKCSAAGILVTELSNHIDLVDELCCNKSIRNKSSLVTLLHGLFEYRETLGFVLFDAEALRRLSAATSQSCAKQTPYIPPRIWAYQLERLYELLLDFNAHQSQIEACYHFCLDAYAKNAGSLEEACRGGRPYKRRPFNAPRNCTGTRSGATYIGEFSDTAQRFGIYDLLIKWSNADLHVVKKVGIRDLSAYMTLVSYGSLAYLLNFSLMRIQEAWFLRTGCLQIETDDQFGHIYILRSRTSKTIQDDEAAWIAAPSSKIAVGAAECIARLRMAAAVANPDAKIPKRDIEHPFLFQRPHEPWANARRSGDVTLRFSTTSYSAVAAGYPKLFSSAELRITNTDLSLAQLVTPTLNRRIFSAGESWNLAWHQLRRTGAVNMRASRLVSSSSLQYQLKHESERMSLYYSQGHPHIRLNESAQAEYARATYDVLALQLTELMSNRFVSPYGQDRKIQLLKLVADNDHEKLLSAAKNGEIAWRETMLGGCCNRGPCEFGGVDNIIRCGGGDGRGPCTEALFDRSRLEVIQELREEIKTRYRSSDVGTPYRSSLEKQLQATENVLRILSV